MWPKRAAYINLDRRPDRRAHVEAELARVGLTAERYRAFTPDEWGGSPRKIQGMLDRGTAGNVGCYMSHVHAMQMAAANRADTLIVEDDVVFCDDLQDRLDYIEKALPAVDPDWDVFFLNSTVHINPPYWHKEGLGRDAQRTADPRILRTYGLFATHALIVNHRNVPRILEAFESRVADCWGIDHLFILLADRLRNYCFVPGCAWQYDNPSDIGTKPGGISHFSRFASIGPHVFQKRMVDFDPATYDWAEAK